MAYESPSKATKDRVAYIATQEIMECGKIAKNLCQHSGSRELFHGCGKCCVRRPGYPRLTACCKVIFSDDVLLKSAKKMASQEVSMENTLRNLRHIEKLQDKALEQANRVGKSVEQTSVVHEQLKGALQQ